MFRSDVDAVDSGCRRRRCHTSTLMHLFVSERYKPIWQKCATVFSARLQNISSTCLRCTACQYWTVLMRSTSTWWQCMTPSGHCHQGTTTMAVPCRHWHYHQSILINIVGLTDSYHHNSQHRKYRLGNLKALFCIKFQKNAGWYPRFLCGNGWHSSSHRNPNTADSGLRSVVLQ